MDSLFRAARKDNFVGTLLFSFVATNLAGFSVPVEVGGARLAYAAMASEAEVLITSYHLLANHQHLPPTTSYYLPATYSPQVPSGSYLSAPAATSKAATRADGSGLC